jgi:hypothetical protein
MSSTIGSKTLLLPPSVAGVRVPDSALAKAAAQLSWSVSPEYLFDVQGVGITNFSAGELREILDAYPRLGLKKQFVQSIVELCRRKPAAQLGHFTAEIGRAHIREFACPTIESTIMAAPYAD